MKILKIGTTKVKCVLNDGQVKVYSAKQEALEFARKTGLEGKSIKADWDNGVITRMSVAGGYGGGERKPYVPYNKQGNSSYQPKQKTEDETTLISIKETLNAVYKLVLELVAEKRPTTVIEPPKPKVEKDIDEFEEDIVKEETVEEDLD
jgi:hypothetical protein